MCVCLCVCVRACVCVRILHIVMLEPLATSTLSVNFGQTADNILHLNVHYVSYTMFVRRFEAQGSQFTKLLLLMDPVEAYNSGWVQGSP